MSPDYRSLEVVACERIYSPHGGCDRPDSDPREVVPFQPVLAPADEPAPTAGADGALAEKHQPGAAGVGVACANRPEQAKFVSMDTGIEAEQPQPAAGDP